MFVAAADISSGAPPLGNEIEGNGCLLLEKHRNSYISVSATRQNTRFERPVITLKILKGDVKIATAHLTHGENLLLLNLVHGLDKKLNLPLLLPFDLNGFAKSVRTEARLNGCESPNNSLIFGGVLILIVFCRISM